MFFVLMTATWLSRLDLLVLLSILQIILDAFTFGLNMVFMSYVWSFESIVHLYFSNSRLTEYQFVVLTCHSGARSTIQDQWLWGGSPVSHGK